MATIETTTSLSMTDAETAVRTALTEQGFGVLTEIDVAEDPGRVQSEFCQSRT
jgi:uncharacterized protein (DUF302 family)